METEEEEEEEEAVTRTAERVLLKLTRRVREVQQQRPLS